MSKVIGKSIFDDNYSYVREMNYDQPSTKTKGYQTKQKVFNQVTHTKTHPFLTSDDKPHNDNMPPIYREMYTFDTYLIEPQTSHIIVRNDKAIDVEHEKPVTEIFVSNIANDSTHFNRQFKNFHQVDKLYHEFKDFSGNSDKSDEMSNKKNMLNKNEFLNGNVESQTPDTINLGHSGQSKTQFADVINRGNSDNLDPQSKKTQFADVINRGNSDNLDPQSKKTQIADVINSEDSNKDGNLCISCQSTKS